MCIRDRVGDAPFPLKSALKVTRPPSKNADFDRFPLIMYQLSEIAKKFSHDEYKVDHGLSNELRMECVRYP